MPRSFSGIFIPPRHVPLGVFALLALAAAALYGHTLGAPWYFDDHAAILKNAAVHDLGRATAGLWQARGVSIFSFALNYRFSGEAVAGYHLTNIGIHLLCAWLVYLLLCRIFVEGKLWPLLGALLFIAHPLQTQAITYVVQRMTSLAALFFLLALELFLRFREEPQAAPGQLRARLHYLGALAAGALAVFAKENAAVLPLALVLFVRCFGSGDRRWRPLLLAAAPFLTAPLLLAAAALLPALFGTGSLAEHAGLGSAAGTPLHYLVTQFSVFWIYLRLLVLPYGQTLDYGYPIVTSLWTVQNVLAFLALAGLGWGGWRLRKHLPTVSFGLGWFFLTLAVESSFIPLDPIFEHRLYLPMFGFVVAMLGLARELPWRRVAVTGLLLAMAVSCYLTWQRNALWNDQLAFSADNVRKAPHSDRALFNLAARTFNTGNVGGGLALLRQSIERFPQSYPAYVELADYYRRNGRIDEAIAVLNGALEHVSEKALIYNNLGFFYMLRQEPEQALALLQKAQQSDPHFADTYFNTARIHAANNRLGQAEEAFLQGFRESQKNPAAYVDFGALLLRQGRRAEALAALRTALRLDPENAAAARLLGEAAE